MGWGLVAETDRQTDRQAGKQTDRERTILILIFLILMITSTRAMSWHKCRRKNKIKQNVAITANMPIYINYFKICDRRSPSSLFHPQQYCGLEKREKKKRNGKKKKKKKNESCCSTDYRSNTLFPHIVRDWNELPPDAVLSPTLGTFKSNVSSPSQ